jgi:adenine-specific DNA-methyltransferase
LYFGITAPDGNDVFPKLPDGGDGAWRWSREKVENDAHLIEWVDGRNGWNPYYRIYEKDDATRPPETLWTFTEVGSTRNSAAEVKALTGGTAFATPKPERLLERILFIGSDPGDIVLDCFAGSGTTAAVAHKMRRRWVTVEQHAETINTFTRPRLEKVVEGTDKGGVTEALGWEGGGGFTVALVGPSMFEDIDGFVVLAEWAVAGELAEGVAAQLGYDYEPDTPFAGRKGRFRLAVIDGVLTADLARYLLHLLPEEERLMAVAQAVEPGVEELVRQLRSGSRVRKVPRDLARTGSRSSGVVQLRLDEVAS